MTKDKQFCLQENPPSKKQSGQALIFMVPILMIIVFLIIILIDSATTIKGKIKSRNATDAAALAGAVWQKNSLNLIGEINMIKATKVLFDLSPTSENRFYSQNSSERQRALEQAIDASKELSELQIRASFVGPIIGFAAAQHAARLNGIPENGDFSTSFKDHLKTIREAYSDASSFPQTVAGYSWREPYLNMLRQAAGGKGHESLAVNCSSTHFLLPYLKSDGSVSIKALRSSNFIGAIINEDWCDLKKYLLGQPDPFANPRWWGNITKHMLIRQPVGSEFFHLNLKLSGNGNANAGDLENYVANSDQMSNSSWGAAGDLFTIYRQLTGEQYKRDQVTRYLDANEFMIYKTKAFLDSDRVWGNYSQEQISRWKFYLVNSFQPGYNYQSGALSYVSAYTPNNTMLQNLRKETRGTIFGLNSSSLAKPFGRLETSSGAMPPHSSSIVLPVFKDVALIPAVLEYPHGEFDYEPAYAFYVSKYLPRLGTAQSLQEMDQWLRGQQYPKGFMKYHNALKKINDPAFRQKGREWLRSPFYKYVFDHELNRFVRVQDGTRGDQCNKSVSGGGGGGGFSGPSVVY